MIQRSRIAPVSEVRSLRQHRGKAPLRPAEAAFRNVMALVIVAAALAYAWPTLFGPAFLHDQARSAAALVITAGDWARAALAAAFQSIPVR